MSSSLSGMCSEMKSASATASSRVAARSTSATFQSARIWVEAGDVEAEGARAQRHAAPDPTDADERQAPPAKPVDISRAAIPVAIPHARGGGHHAAGDTEKQSERVVCDLVEAVVGDVGHQHAGARGGRHVDVVVADPVAGDDPAARSSVDHAGTDLRVGHEDRVGVRDGRDERVLIGRVGDDELGADRLERCDLDGKIIGEEIGHDHAQGARH